MGNCFALSPRGERMFDQNPTYCPVSSSQLTFKLLLVNMAKKARQLQAQSDRSLLDS